MASYNKNVFIFLNGFKRKNQFKNEKKKLLKNKKPEF